jgi:hypothetical protein
VFSLVAPSAFLRSMGVTPDLAHPLRLRVGCVVRIMGQQKGTLSFLQVPHQPVFQRGAHTGIDNLEFLFLDDVGFSFVFAFASLRCVLRRAPHSRNGSSSNSLPVVTCVVSGVYSLHPSEGVIN